MSLRGLNTSQRSFRGFLTSRSAPGVFGCLLAVVVAIVATPGESAAAVDYGQHNISHPVTWNGYKVYISPGHNANENTFPCGVEAGSTSEWREAWHVGYDLRDSLLADGYQVMMPKKLSTGKVSYTTRVQTAGDWWSNHSNARFLYIAIHSNGHNTTSCVHNSTHHHGGTQQLYQTSRQSDAGNEMYGYLAAHTVASAHEMRWGNYCNFRAITELCSSYASDLPVAYMESEFHDTNGGSDYLTAHHRGSANWPAAFMNRGTDCELRGVSC